MRTNNGVAPDLEALAGKSTDSHRRCLKALRACPALARQTGNHGIEALALAAPPRKSHRSPADAGATRPGLPRGCRPRRRAGPGDRKDARVATPCHAEPARGIDTRPRPGRGPP